MPFARAILVLTLLSIFFVANLLAISPAFSWFDKDPRIVALIAQTTKFASKIENSVQSDFMPERIQVNLTHRQSMITM